MRVSVWRLLAHQLAGLAFAGLLVMPLIVFGSGQLRAVKGHILQGIARVVDGDTIVLGQTRIRLEGIDAPETTQACKFASGGNWNCGEEATRQLVKLIAGRSVVCDDLGLDKYGRTLGRCFAGGVELNAEMVRSGYAWAFVRYSNTYVSQEAQARGVRVGVWQGEAVPAWDFRAGSWTQAESNAPAGCTIKGNVTTSGRIYHMPWSPWYEKVRMDDKSGSNIKGKRWFCSEGEAISAGWRPALTR